MRTFSPTQNGRHLADGLDSVQKGCSVEMQSSMNNVWQNDRNALNDCTVYANDMVAKPKSVSFSNNENASEFIEYHQKLNKNDQSIEDTPKMPQKTRDYASLTSLPDTFVATDFKKEYTQIRNRETRKKYKLEFSRNYDRYRELHCKIEKVSKRFSGLESQLKREPEGSESFKVSILTTLYT